MNESIAQLSKTVDDKVNLMRPLTEWRKILAQECGVYTYEDSYIGKSFADINYQFIDKEKAKEIVVDNLYALLRFKYFTNLTEEVDKRIAEIVSSFTTNLKTTLIAISFDENTIDNNTIDNNILDEQNNISVNSELTLRSVTKKFRFLPDYCIAFRNGVYDFKNDRWMFRYLVINMNNNNKLVLYDEEYVITWYMDFDFEPLPISISEMDLNKFISFMKEYTKDSKNYCFELMYNISHDINHQFESGRFEHLCEILGYTCLQSFSQNFVMLIGSGQNGKNSLFDGCFSYKLKPRPANIDMNTIEEDRFVTGALYNKYHNIFLESDAKTYKKSTNLKALTGSMYQSIEDKGVSKHSGIINCKYLFAGNDRESTKFADMTAGFQRRINLYEIYYKWDKDKFFLKLSDYYDTSFSDNLVELKSDLTNYIIYIYFAMYGIKIATKNFTRSFQFTKNEFNTLSYGDADFSYKDQVLTITTEQIITYLYIHRADKNIANTIFNKNKVALKWNTNLFKKFKACDFREFITNIKKEIDTPDEYSIIEDEKGKKSKQLINSHKQTAIEIFEEECYYITFKLLRGILNIDDLPSTKQRFYQNICKTFNISSIEKSLYKHDYFVKCLLSNKIIKLF